MKMTNSSGTSKTTYHNAVLYIIIVIGKEEMAMKFLSTILFTLK